MFKKILTALKGNQVKIKRMSVFDEIQSDILGSTDLSVILRKAKVLAFKLKNKEFKDWVENELNGYNDNDSLPEYRKVSTVANGNFINTSWHSKGVPIPLHNIPSEFHHHFNEIRLFQGVKELESLIDTIDKSNEDSLQSPVPAELLPLLSETIYQYMHCIGAWRVLTKAHITQIIETTRNALLNFILELSDRYPEIKSDSYSGEQIPNEQIQQVFNYYILGGKHQIVGSSNSINQGDNMTVFDQRDQKVNTQYNAAGDINFNSAQNSNEFVAELQKLKDEFLRVAQEEAIDAEIVTDAEYQLTKAIQQAEKPEPNKLTILSHLENAKQLVDGVETGVKIATYLTTAIEIAKAIFG